MFIVLNTSIYLWENVPLEGQKEANEKQALENIFSAIFGAEFFPPSVFLMRKCRHLLCAS